MASLALRVHTPEGRGALLAVVLGSGVAFLDQSVVNVALPSIGHSLGLGVAGLQWTVDAYLLTLSALLLVGGALGDRLGRRRVFAGGLAWFALWSAACGLAPSGPVLVTARALQGVGGALLVPGSLALLRGSFEEHDQASAVGIWAGFSGVTSAAGPLLGGWLVEAVSWRAVFLINLPLVAVTIWAARRWVPESRDDAAPRRLDAPGAIAATCALGGAVFGLIEGARLGWTDARVLGAWGVALAASVAFVAVERRSLHPMLPLELFRSRRFTAANLVTLAMYFGLGGAVFLFVVELQVRCGWSPFAAGASLTPVTVLVLVLSPGAGRLAQRIGARAPMTVGPAVAAAGLVVLGRVGPGSAYVADILPGVVALGLGLGAAVAPLTEVALDAVEPRHAGVASGVNNAVARVAGLMAVAVLPVAGGLTSAGMTASQGSFAVGLRIAALACAVGGAIALAGIGGRPRRAAP